MFKKAQSRFMGDIYSVPHAHFFATVFPIRLAAALSVFVLVVLVTSAQYGMTLAQESASLSILTKQLIALFVGLLCACALVVWNYRQLQSYARSLYVIGGVLLLSVLFWCHTTLGTTGGLMWNLRCSAC